MDGASACRPVAVDDATGDGTDVGIALATEVVVPATDGGLVLAPNLKDDDVEGVGFSSSLEELDGWSGR